MTKSNNIILIGDIHGKIDDVFNLCKKYNTHTFLGIGDIGLKSEHQILPQNFYFFRGNHDNPILKKHVKYAVDYGMWNEIYIVAGGDSIDKKERMAGYDWWPNEQLDRQTMDLVLEDYIAKKPKILVAHEAPFLLHASLKKKVVSENPFLSIYGEPRGNSTAFLLDTMIQHHKPELMVFGHWHTSFTETISNCKFICLNKLETYII